MYFQIFFVDCAEKHPDPKTVCELGFTMSLWGGESIFFPLCFLDFYQHSQTRLTKPRVGKDQLWGCSSGTDPVADSMTLG